MNTEFCIAVGGENLIDYVTQDGKVTAHPGGSPFNVAMALGRQGINVHYISPISTDEWGDMLAAKLETSGVVLSGGRRPEPTTMARVSVSKGIPSYSFERAGTAERMITAGFLNERLRGTAKALHTGSLTLTDGPDAEIWESVCAKSYADGRLTSLDPNVRLSVISDVAGYRERIRRMLTRTHIVKLSDEDLEALFPGLEQAEALTSLLAVTAAPLVVLTRGEAGCLACLGGSRIDLPAAPVTRLVDTVGAGDTFTATLLAGLARMNALAPSALEALTRDQLTGLLHCASAAAAINCGRAGCNPPSRVELDAETTGTA